MSDNIKDMIRAASEKDAGGFEAAFNAVMADKIEAGLDKAYASMFEPAAEAAEVEASEAETDLETEE